MAILRKYRCKKCGLEVIASQYPYATTMAGLYAQCYCKNCKTISTISAGENYQVDITKLNLHCESCGNTVSAWSPDMGCPECGGAMKQHNNLIE